MGHAIGQGIADALTLNAQSHQTALNTIQVKRALSDAGRG
jgi:hypothetical protein